MNNKLKTLLKHSAIMLGALVVTIVGTVSLRPYKELDYYVLSFYWLIFIAYCVRNYILIKNTKEEDDIYKGDGGL